MKLEDQTKLWTAIFTMRSGKIRIISVRRARAEGSERYEQEQSKTVQEFDRRFDEGESIFDLAEVTSVCRPNLEPQRVNVDFPKHRTSEEFVALAVQRGCIHYRNRIQVPVDKDC